MRVTYSPGSVEQALKGPRGLWRRMQPLLEVVDLCVTYAAQTGGIAHALQGVSFAIERRETLGVLGESGSGKSTLAAALLQILHPSGVAENGVVRFEGHDLMQASPGALQKIRGGRIGVIFQEPLLALHPAIRVGEQVGDILAAHEPMSRRAIRERSLLALQTVFSKDAEQIAESYPHQLSGGQRARVLIAQAIVCGTSLVIADEPTASLDPVTQSEVASLFRSLREQFDVSMLLITHNPLLLAGLADRVLVLYSGKVVEIGPAQDVLSSPRHPYTRDLLRCVPPLSRADRTNRKNWLPVIRDDSPSPAASKQKCSFEGRCADRMEVCTFREPATLALTETHKVSCFKYGG
jgi:oligopeptide/dipeptide ABC transporter ATP-binding protein